MSENKTFSDEEVKKFLLSTHLKNHMFEYVLKILLKMAFAAVIVLVSHGTEYLTAILIGFVLGAAEVLFEIKSYKKDWIELELAKKNSK